MSTKGMSFYQSKEYRENQRLGQLKRWKSSGIRYDKGYRLLYRPDHPYNMQNYVYEHRLVMENHIKRYLKRDEVVHHVNGIKNDNRIENLELMTRSEHSKRHIPKGSRVGRNAT